MDDNRIQSILDLSGENGVELLLRDESVLVEVGTPDQLFEFLIGHVLAELISDPPEVLDGDEAGSLVVEEVEDFAYVGLAVPVIDPLGHEGEPLSEVDGSVSVGVEVGNHLEDGCTLGLESERGHCCLQFCK